MFERFYRVDKSHSKQTGNGAWPLIVKHGALFHDARVSLESQGGKGAQNSYAFHRNRESRHWKEEKALGMPKAFLVAFFSLL